MHATPERPPFVRPSLIGAALLAVLCLYGVQSTPGLVGRWGASGGGFALALGWAGLAALAVPLIRAAPSRLHIALLVGVAVAVRIGFALLVLDRGPQGDAAAYLALAASVREGHGLAIAEPTLGIVVRAFFPPLYPCVLAGWSALFGTSTWSLLALSTLLDAATAAAIGWLGARVGSAGAGRGAAWLYLIWPSALFSAPLAQKESLCALLVVVLAAAWVAAERARSRWRPIVVIGVAAGLLALTQPGEAALAGLFGLVLIRRLRLSGVLGGVLRVGVPAALIAALVLLPWWVRNWALFGRFVPLTTASGVGVWIGNNADATGNWIPPPASLRGLPELEFGSRAAARARAWIAGHPLGFLVLNATKFFRACGVGQAGLIRLAAMHPPLGLALTALLFPLAQLAHLAMLGGAAWAARARANPALATLLLLALACAIQLLVFGVWFEFSERHREFATPFLLLLVCCAAEGNWRAMLDEDEHYVYAVAL